MCASVLQLAEILRSISAEELHRLRSNLAKYYGAFIWEQGGGGLAYNFTILALQRRYRCAMSCNMLTHGTRRACGCSLLLRHVSGCIKSKLPCTVQHTPDIVNTLCC
jgi:hypothetical protein